MLVVLLVTGLAGLTLSSAVVTLVRDRLRFSCEIIARGVEGGGEWTCSDGIGYLIPVAAMTGLGLVATLTGFARTRSGMGRQSARLLTIMAVCVAAGAFTVSAVASNGSAGAETSQPSGVELWSSHVGSAAIVAGVSAVVGLSALWARRRAACALSAMSAFGMLAASALQTGLAAALVPAAGVLIVVAITSREAPHESRRSVATRPIRSPRVSE